MTVKGWIHRFALSLIGSSLLILSGCGLLQPGTDTNQTPPRESSPTVSDANTNRDSSSENKPLIPPQNTEPRPSSPSAEERQTPQSGPMVRENKSTSTSNSDRDLIEPNMNERSRDSNIQALARQAEKAYRNGNLVQAVQKYKQASEQDPDNPLFPFNIGSIYFEKQDYENARTFYKQALDRNSNHEDANLYMGATHLRMNNPEKARQHLETVLEINPNNSEAQQLLKSLSDSDS